jgi:ribosomal protein S12 methylthiotransferase accessory factor
MSRIGVTRVSDSTGLDVLGIPVFSAIRPTDAGMSGISVYNGKGLTKSESRAGAMMEAVERYCGEFWSNTSYSGTLAEMKAQFSTGLLFDPEIMNLQQNHPYDTQMSLEWGKCWDLISNQEIMVPLNFIICPYYGAAAGTWYSSSNGLASGNTLEEAICHALAELIERDAYTMAMVRAQLAPRFRSFVDCVSQDQPFPDRIPPDRSMFPLIDLHTLPLPVKRLVKRVQQHGAKIWLRNITSDFGIPSFVASIQETGPHGRELAAGGFGCHPNAVVAAIRAITEAAQGRIVQIQGVREDATRIGEYAGGDRVLWCNNDGEIVAFDSIKTYEHKDILDDILLMLNNLKEGGISKVIVADLSISDIPAAVVRLIIPELEAWMLTDFAADKCNLGSRAQQILQGMACVQFG